MTNFIKGGMKLTQVVKSLAIEKAGLESQLQRITKISAAQKARWAE
jgi:hypothetical protein